MDGEEVDREFFGMAMNQYAESLQGFIEDTRRMELLIRGAIMEGDQQKVMELTAQMFHAVSTVQVGNIHNLVTAYAHSLNDERSAGIEVYDLGHEILADLRELHRHLVAIAQPTQELSMVVDLMTKLGDGLDNSQYGRMVADAG